MNIHYYELSEEQSKRINILRMLLAIFVVYIHSTVSNINLSTETSTMILPRWFDYYCYAFSEVIPRCAVWGFIFVSSILLYRKDFTWKDNMKKKFKSIIIPYILMNAFWIVVYAVAQNIPQTQIFFANENNIVSEFTFSRWLHAFGIGEKFPFLYPLWFLKNLFILNILAVLIKKMIDLLPRIVFIILGIVLLFVPDFPLNNFEQLLYPMDLCVWCFGYYFVKYKRNFGKLEKYSPHIAIIFVLTCSYRIITQGNGIPWFGLYRICLIVDLLFWYIVFTKNYNGKLQRLLLKYSSYSFGIYLFHEMSLTFCKKLIVKLFGNTEIVLIIEYLFLPIFIVLFAIFLCKSLKRLFPKAYNVLLGAR